jgi:hypothetical protein
MGVKGRRYVTTKIKGNPAKIDEVLHIYSYT